jgi:3-deoxy-7-phosphoheptulonate synthase
MSEKLYELASREAKGEDSIVFVNGVAVGGPEPVFIGGPCVVESREQILECARAVKAAGGQLLCGAVYVPSPYSAAGLGEEGLRYLAEARREFNLGIVTEAVDLETLAAAEAYADCIQIGSRNMQNYSLLRYAGRSRCPILLKRSPYATLAELLMAAEYILAGGNEDVILCERGVRTFDSHARNTLDLSMVPAVQALSHLPIIVDPSHGTGVREYVYPMALAAIAAGAAGVVVESAAPHHCGHSGHDHVVDTALFAHLVRDCRAIARLRHSHADAPASVEASYITARQR